MRRSAHVRSLLLLAIVLLLASGCGSGRGTTDPRTSPDDRTHAADDAGRAPSRSLQGLILERAPGFRVEQTADGRLVVRLRTPTNFHGSDQPLYVVDNMPVDPNPDGSLPGVPVSEIASIRILNDPASTSPYGMRGANGVIVVTTRQGRQR